MAAVTELDGVIQAGGDLLAIHDRFMDGMAGGDNLASKRLFLAACFGAEAFKTCEIEDAAPGVMLRAMLLALVNPMDPRLDYLRAINQKAVV